MCIRDRAYNGASNMSGKTNGTAARISSLYPLALYTHCEVSVRNFRCSYHLSAFFFAHPKRQKKLEEVIHSTQPESNVMKLEDLCRTRWIEHTDALDRVKRLHSSIVACFES